MKEIIILLDIHSLNSKDNIDNRITKFIYQYFPYVNIDITEDSKKTNIENDMWIIWKYYYNLIDEVLSQYTYVYVKSINCNSNIANIHLEVEG